MDYDISQISRRYCKGRGLDHLTTSSVVYTLKGWDPEGSRLSYYISGGPLAVDKESGEVTLIRPLDREEEPVLDVIISVSDEASAGQEPNTVCSQQDVVGQVSFKREISILDVNDNVPAFFNLPTTSLFLSSSEKSPLTTDSSVFIKLNTLLLKVERILYIGNYLSLYNHCSTLVTLYPYTTSALHCPIFIPIQPVLYIVLYIDNSLSLYNQSSTLDAQAGTTVYRGVFVSDPDLGANSEVKLSCLAHMTPQACSTFGVRTFQIGEGNYQGEVLLRKSLDFEERRNYTMALSAQDQSPTKPLNATVNVLIKVTDIQDMPPVFLNEPFSTTLVENTAQGVSVMEMWAQDGDRGVPRQLKLSLLNDRKNYFSLSVSYIPEKSNYKALLMTTSNPIDREDPDILSTGGIYTFQILAEEATADGMTAVANVTVVVHDQNDQVPRFNSRLYNVSVPEDTSVNSPVAGFSAMVQDLDVGENAKFNISLENGHGIFSVVPSTAIGKTPLILKVTDPSQLDYENPEKRFYELKLVAAQEDGSGSSTATVNVWVEDVNDNSPQFLDNQYLFQVPENAPMGADLFSLRAIDLDSGLNGKLTYSLKGYSSEKFHVEPETGMVRVGACCLDFETEPSYSLTYMARDGGGKSASVNLFIEILDVNDNTPAFLQDEYFLELSYATTKISPPLFVKASRSGASARSAQGQVNGAGEELGRSDVSERALRDHRAGECPGRTISRRLVANGLHSCRPLRRLPLTPPNRRQRLEWCRGRSTWMTEWHRVVFSDESRFCLSSDSRRVRVWRRRGERSNTAAIVERPTVRQRGIMVWGAIAYDSRSPLLRIQGTMTAQRYVDDVLRPVTLPYLQGVPNALYQQDNARPHTARISQQALQDVQMLPWPPYSPDLSPIEHVWDIIGRRLHALPQPRSEDELWQMFEREWRAIPQDAIRKSVLKVSATGPGTSYLIESGSRDSFVLEKDTGILRVAPEARLVALDEYRIQVQAIDNQQRTSTAPVLIRVEDVNNIAPKFSQETYTRHISEEQTDYKNNIATKMKGSPHGGGAGMKVGHEVLKLAAKDPDVTANLVYGLVEPFQAQDRTGAMLDSSASFDFKNAFKINESTGSVTLNLPLDRNAASVIILTAQVTDTHAVGPKQVDKVPEEGNRLCRGAAEVVLYVESGSGGAVPVFSPAWTSVDVPEETRVGTALVTLTARDPITQQPVSHYEKVPTEGEPLDLVQVGPTNGAVILSSRLDYEALKPYGSKFSVSVKAVSGQGSSTATVQFNILDINDNSPLFTEDEYSAQVLESARHPDVVLTVKATDRDTDQGFGVVRYSVSGDGSHLLDIHPVTGEIFVKEGAELDREVQEQYNLVVTAYDNPDKPANQRRTSVLARIQLTDVNDNEPRFNQDSYSAVIPESALPGSSILTVRASDPDDDVNGRVHFSLSQENPVSSKERVLHKLALTGVRAAYFSVDTETGENASLHTSVFRIVAYDPDGPSRASGRIMYRFLDDGVTDFTIDAATGVVRTARLLDRETRENYTWREISGPPPQESHAVLKVLVIDVNDNAPFFNKIGPLTFHLIEEVPLGSVVGHVEAHDYDIGENAKLVYHIVGGNENETFGMHDTADGKGEIFTKSRIDCEAKSRYDLTIRVANSWLGENLTEAYDPSDPGQVRVTVMIEDLDDHPPVFDRTSYATGKILRSGSLWCILDKNRRHQSEDSMAT
ncbi:hypothetical protein LAZ67_X001708 [Cordylochernes scorpioides]|uniref:Cadherin domain-containing protein n=1 Tax=Cordylochernes scorpioides TaxID=51811 RepID=A0ABY6LSQ4_9ARAC|nr:hypothetical protein LAZ67_X001708 [Cordylochernes scorpioides]